MDIYATTNPAGSGSYYWQTSEWYFDDMISDMGREILVIPYRDACKQLNSATPCTLTIDLNVTGLDVYNVMVTTSYIPELCQAELICDMAWADPRKQCCFYDAYYNEIDNLGDPCVAGEAKQAANDTVLLSVSSSPSKKELFLMN